ncbi:hypothetical protein ABT010_38250 [Streptomyces sp. NPDC002668]|uniref:hypothetical protein n=1 Tax=Streptomyces sp. NPDC002668 TaxID=3154422 RepID=UPI0033231823
MTLLNCLAIEPRMGGVLLFDLEPSLLPLLGGLLAERLSPDAPHGQNANVVVLGSWATPEELWLRTAPSDDGFAVRPGALVEDVADPPPVVLIPDLRHAALPVTQAAVALLDADAASVERLGHSLRWRPRARWLAALPRTAAGQLSPHLLDRFPVRGNAAGLYQELRALREQAGQPADEMGLLRAAMPAPPSANWTPAPLSPEAARLVVSLMPASPSRRRDLALARAARALAADAPAVGPDQVRAAAQLLGLGLPETSGAPQPAPVPEPPFEPREQPLAPSGGPSRRGTTPTASVESEAGPVAAAGPPQPLEPEPAPLLGDAGLSPYPEDDPEALPPSASLRSRPRPSAGSRPLRGQRIGVQAAREVHDLAVIPTLLEAVKFQAIRRHLHAQPPYRGLIVGAADLRQYRRSQESARALVLVLDHSCRTGWDVGPALAPYLRWSYQENTTVCVIEFGHRDTANELIAERYRAASLLDPRILNSLARPPGLASPLAHALDLAVQELRRLGRRGRAGLDDAVLVVVTDGRGNVPLDASVRGLTPTRVSREGVTDMLTVAATVRKLSRVRPVVIAPETGLYPELAFDLAEAMGGHLIAVPPRQASTRTAGPGR